eukprot:comp7028_c0_seq1/m.2761 comp7028_c0_seq1/g.2761  ORF comp7028_c0_seq1/g.2761 comp7028_c0_seq1/m.2761 type:complete len:334 (-) comp7028_c0_seq1:306-1307(-)
MEALLLTKPGRISEDFVVGTTEKPAPAVNELLVRIQYTALNPVDYKMAQYGLFIPSYPIALGCDMAGVVEAVGSDVTEFKVGDVVAGYPGLGRPGRGTFAQYCVIPEKMAWKKPPAITTEQLSTVGVSTLTASLGLYNILKLARPSNPSTTGEWVLVWGGSGSVGSQAVQLARLSGYKVVAAASKKNEQWLKSLGATAVVDYRDSDTVEQIKKVTGGQLRYVYDTVGPATAAKALEATAPGAEVFIAGSGGVPENLPENVRGGMVNLGYGFDVPAVRGVLEQDVSELGALVADGKLRLNEVDLLEGGLGAIANGLDLLASGKVGGKKLVMNIP